MEPLRSAVGFEGLIVLAVIYLVLNLLSKAGKKQARSNQPPADAPDEASATQEEGLSLEKILREIERVKHQAEAAKSAPPRQLPTGTPRPTPRAQTELKERLKQQRAERQPRRLRPEPMAERGPLGRHGRTSLPGAEEVEERESLEGGSLEVEERIEVLDNRVRVRVDHDEQAEALVQRRIDAAQARNQAHTAADHRAFHAKAEAAKPTAQAATATDVRRTQLRDAFVWREILGPPRAIDEL